MHGEIVGIYLTNEAESKKKNTVRKFSSFLMLYQLVRMDIA
jgi:hypothetical protein